MKGFLNHLAGMALGVKPTSAARPSLPSRFAQPSSAIGPRRQVLEAIEEAGQSTSARLGAMLPMDGSRGHRAPDAEAARIEHPVVFVEQPDERPPEKLLTQAFSRPDDPHAPETRAGLENAAHPSPFGPLAEPGNGVWRAASVSPSLVNISSARVRPDPHSTPTAMASRLLSDPPASHPETRAAPLGEAIVAGRTAAARQERPVIHVAIDRIDVRAPASPRPAAEHRRARSQPTVSLSDYLRESARGGRG